MVGNRNATGPQVLVEGHVAAGPERSQSQAGKLEVPELWLVLFRETHGSDRKQETMLQVSGSWSRVVSHVAVAGKRQTDRHAMQSEVGYLLVGYLFMEVKGEKG